ncbi:MAG TPA: hypothetical protein DCX39_04995 [Firmicutes bacterium]|nr:hypothetical protein [Bacillota bacterium]HAX00492.1 hypothetical protein [Bacillota bacterium]
MKKRRREEKGAVLIATIAILAFVVIIMMGFLGQLVLYTSNYSSSLNNAYKVKRILTNDCYLFVENIDSSKTIDENISTISGLLENSEYVDESMTYYIDTDVKIGGNFSLTYKRYQADVVFVINDSTITLKSLSIKGAK